MFNINCYVWYQVFTAVAVANTVFWEVMLCSQLAGENSADRFLPDEVATDFRGQY
jgi:hypothetical protein